MFAALNACYGFLSFSVSVHGNTGYKQNIRSKKISLRHRKPFLFPKCISDKTFSIRKIFLVSLSTIPSVSESAVFLFSEKVSRCKHYLKKLSSEKFIEFTFCRETNFMIYSFSLKTAQTAAATRRKNHAKGA